MALSRSVVTGCCNGVLEMERGVVTGLLSRSVVTWCCNGVLSRGVVTGCCHMLLCVLHG